jgi:hypothetical protein
MDEQFDNADVAEAGQRLAQTVDGRTVLDDLEKRFAYRLSSTYGGNGQSPLDLSWREGQRAVICYLSRQLKRKPENMPKDAEYAPQPTLL